MESFYSNGKLLLTGEYAILDGAKGLALPTKFGQYLYVAKSDGSELSWKSTDEKGTCWFEARYDLERMTEISCSHPEISKTLLGILKAAQGLNPDFLESGFDVTSQLTFPRDWGLGSSSTLINNLAQWAQIDAFGLLERSFGGSGYDIACAQHNKPITYRITKGRPIIEEVVFDPAFKEHLFFVYLNKKQNSREGISQYRKTVQNVNKLINEVNGITDKICFCETLEDFESLIKIHEDLISKTLQIPKVKNFLFSDYNGAIKSLGAWGGDFVLATGNGAMTMKYFRDRGFQTIIPYSKMVL